MTRIAAFVRRHPFALLGLATMFIGAVWHSPLVSPESRPTLQPLITVIGTPFIAAMRLVSRTLPPSVLTPILGTLLGLAPYLAADWLLRRRRDAAPARREPPAA